MSSGRACIEGVGIHTGKPASLVLLKGVTGAGPRILSPASVPWPVAALGRDGSGRRTTVAFPDGGTLSTVEHLMAALDFCGMPDVDVACRGPEVPAADGSSLPFSRAIEQAGLSRGAGTAPELVVSRPFSFSFGPSRYEARPGARSVTATVDYPGTWLECETATIRPGRGPHEAARTFVLESDLPSLSAAGLGLGGALSNALVIGSGGPLNEGGYRVPRECAVHKAVDLVGDLALCGFRVSGAIAAFRPGHEANAAFLDALLASGSLVPARALEAA